MVSLVSFGILSREETRFSFFFSSLQKYKVNPILVCEMTPDTLSVRPGQMERLESVKTFECPDERQRLCTV